MRGNIVRSEEWVVMRYSSVLDLHTHTLVSGHAYCSLREMAKAAADKGLEVLGITEHAPAMPGTCHKYYFENLKIVPREMYGIQLLLGSEVNILDAQGTVDLAQRTLERMDVVIASLHMPCMKPGSKLENTESYLNVMKNPYVNIIGHPDDGRYEIDYEALVQGAKEYGKVLELNNHSMDPDCNRQNAVENDTVMLELCKKYQVPVVMDSDAHFDLLIGEYLNRHHTMEAYIAAKENIARNQTEDDYCVLNYEEPVMRKFAETLKCHVLFFSSQHKLEKGIYLDNDKIIYKNPDEVEVCHVDELQILGTHNYENVMAAVCMAAVYGVPMETIRKAILAFKGVAQRIEYVAEKNGVVYYNDSKGTNPDAAIKAIQAMRRPTILLGGGYDKDSEYTEWINSFDGKVKKLILMGATKEKIARDCEKCDFHDYVYVDTFEEAMDLAVEMAEPGDAVLLSPACASWGMFPNYEVRGDKFKEIVNSL